MDSKSARGDPASKPAPEPASKPALEPEPERLPLAARVRGVLAVLGETPRVVALIWRAHPPTAAIVLALNVVQGLSPLINGWLAKRILDAVAAAVNGRGDVSAAVPPIVALLVARAA